MILTTLINLDGPTGWVVMLLPFAMLAVVVVGVVVSRDRAAVEVEADAQSVPLPRERQAGADAILDARTAPATTPASAPTPVARSAPQPSAGASDASQAGSGAHTPAARQGEATLPPAPRPEPSPPRPAPTSASAPDAAPPWSAGPAHTRPTPAAAAGGPRPVAPAASDLEAQLVAAEERFDDAAVARLSLALARGLIASDAPAQTTQAHLRRAIILASRLGDNDTHAAARLELGDMLGAEGDMTTACEHWQIARQIFWDRGDKAELADVDERMVANGCPTDWVLNDF